MMNKLRWPELITALLLMIGGVVLVLVPKPTMLGVTNAIGNLVMVVGVIFVISFLLRKKVASGNLDLVKGVILIGIGMFIRMNGKQIFSIIPIILGIFLAVSGLLKVQRALDLHKMHYDSWMKVMMTALLNILIGLLVVINPFETAAWVLRLVGAGFIYSGTSDFFTSLYVSRKAHQYDKQNEAAMERSDEAPVSVNATIEEKDL